MSATKTPWRCPKCGASADAGFYCFCDGETAEDHGETFADPCHDAECEACGWKGTFPSEADRWARAALAAVEGIPTEALESGALGKALDALVAVYEGRSAMFSDTLRSLGRIK